MHVDEWLQAIPPVWICALVGLVIGLESLGIPLPGEIVLVSSALLAAQGVVSPVWVGVCATVGAVVGDSVGYAIGRRGGKPMFDRLGRRFPKHFGPSHIAKAERYFERYGMWTVFFGRFIALLRILAGPLAGALRMPYWRFLTANVLGGIAWAGGTTAVVYYLGRVAEQWLKGFSWAGLGLAVLFGVATTLFVKRRAAKMAAEEAEEPAGTA
ncbi:MULTISPECIES: DedA family protein [Streptosporangium]|uniref:Membrane protein DedA with SNARE-associated domain n=1 Tax=Streptosporangium brasiliense TaxID=47480 RepID=A0ABT9RMK6_9ACTN|nr:DedA family protein [Streptosporangium brasiliense]MDP9869959.1 membrane protein DedA with SNARE-associated domain [Streptosporangium brasiliense]